MSKSQSRQIVVPGELLDDSGRLQPGPNTYREGDRIYATRLGIRSERGSMVGVTSLTGRYDPMRGDMIIGTVVEVGPSNWYLNVGAPHDVGLHVNDVPWRVEFGETSKYLAVGDTVLLKIYNVDQMRKVQVTMKDRACRKLTGGLTVEVAPSKIPRLIGRGGSMITMIKNVTDTRMFVGQNGVVWLDGEPEDVALAVLAIREVESEAHTAGLTETIKKFLLERRPDYKADAHAASEEALYGGQEFDRAERADDSPAEEAPESPESDDDEESSDDGDEPSADEKAPRGRAPAGGRARRGRARKPRGGGRSND